MEPRFRRTDERFVDPTTRHAMRVWLDPADRRAALPGRGLRSAAPSGGLDRSAGACYPRPPGPLHVRTRARSPSPPMAAVDPRAARPARPVVPARPRRRPAGRRAPLPVPQPRAVVARVQRARAATRPATSATRCWSGSSSWRSSPATSTSSSRSAIAGLRQQVEAGERRPLARRPHRRRAARRRPGAGPRARRRPFGDLRRRPAGARRRGHRDRRLRGDPRAPRRPPPALPRRDLPGPDAARGRPRPPVPVHLDAQPLDRRRACATRRPASAASPGSRSRRSCRGCSRSSRTRFVLIDQVIEANLDALFTGMEVVEHHLFRVTRNADLTLEEDEADDLLHGDRGGAPAAALRRGGPPRGRALDAGRPPGSCCCAASAWPTPTATRSAACST